MPVTCCKTSKPVGRRLPWIPSPLQRVSRLIILSSLSQSVSSFTLCCIAMARCVSSCSIRCSICFMPSSYLMSAYVATAQRRGSKCPDGKPGKGHGSRILSRTSSVRSPDCVLRLDLMLRTERCRISCTVIDGIVLDPPYQC